ncbi:DUF2339 domain-containing protein [Novosphingobium sp.]|uniref:DUF2339 domain-containing protein n=1 Tax=Novosphingobium sp. TaxID=1874826 RepID=UPI001ECFF114|nr:DUF2339 domain-containing protein [Novosphingobium sp.]MBK9010590.1 DUF2339 domain-containing protein [Novosphingobium sp.]
MVLWTVLAFATLGWIASEFSGFGLILGGMAGLPFGLWLRSAMRGEIARAVAQALHSQAHDAQAEPAARAEAEEPADLAPAQPKQASTLGEPAPGMEARQSPAEIIAPAWPEPAANGPAVSATQPAIPREPSLAEQWVAAARDWLLGGNTIVRVGLVILFVGLSFLARYAAQAGLFPIEARLALVAAAGAALLVVGFNRRTARPDFALALQGGGVAVMYLTVFAAARLYDVVPMGAAFALMILFAALGCALALLQDARGMALVSFLGGFAVPVLLGGDSRTPLPLFTYYTVLNAAILVIAWKKSWRALNLLGFFATFGMAIVWGQTSYAPQHYLTCQIFLAISVGIYLATAVLYAHNTPGKLGNAVDSTLLFGPAMAGFGLQAGMMRGSEFGSAFSALAFGAVYLGITAFTMRRAKQEMRLLNECLLAIGVGFVTLAVPLALDAKWTSAAWALEGAGAFWVGKRQARWMPRAFGLLLQAVAALVLLGNLPSSVSAVPVLNNGFVSPLLIALPLLLTAWWLRGDLPHSGSRAALAYAPVERALRNPAFLGGFLFVAIALFQEVTRSIPAAKAFDLAQPVLTYETQLLTFMVALLAAAALADGFGRRKDWAVASWPGRASLPLLFLTFMLSLGLGRHVLYLPDIALWLAALGLHFWMLRSSDRGSAPDAKRSGWNYLVHAATVWLLTGMVADSLDLGIDRAALWDTSWAGVVFLVSVVAVLMLLTRWAGRAAPLQDRSGLRWPLHPHAPAYYWTAAVVLAMLAWTGALFTAMLAAGVTDPLPYVPLLNPVDLSVALALVALELWRRMVLTAKPQPGAAGFLAGKGALAMAAILGFVEVNTIWLRSAHHYLGVGYDPVSLGESQVVQTGLAILWTLLAMGLMLLAKRRAMRVPWLLGAGLLGVVVAKLVFVDMSTAEGWARIVTFIGVGVLFLVIGYFVPLPPRKGAQETA